jgi:hypothetical protein
VPVVPAGLGAAPSTVTVPADDSPATAPAVTPAVPAVTPPAVPAVTPAAVSTVAPVATLSAFTSVSSLGPDGTPLAAGAGPSLPVAGLVMADRIVVQKRDRRLYLMNHGAVIAEYPIKLGLSPKGHKQFEGDFRTPEGVYRLSRRNARSEYFLSVEVSYPNDIDRVLAKREGLRPGGAIMIHGQPNVPRRPPEYYANNDWTDGCIAVSNSDMVDIWQRTRLGIPIEIRP